MSDLKLFRIHAGQAAEIEGKSVGLEKSLQPLIEQHLEAFVGVKFLAKNSSEATGQLRAVQFHP